MRENTMETCKTCARATHAGELTRQQDLYLCGEWVATFQDHTGCTAIVWVLVNGDGAGCVDGYARNEAVFAEVWACELRERQAEQETPLHVRNGVVPGRDFPGTLFTNYKA